MNLIKTLKKAGCLLSFIALPLLLAAGPIPFTQNQFPVWYAVGQSSLTTSTTETNIFQVAVPPQVMGNNGMLRLTYFFQKNDVTNTATFTTYLGNGLNPATAVPVNTNSLKAAATHSVVQGWLFTAGASGATNNTFIGTTTTNNWNGIGQVALTPTVATSTNGLFLTVTAQGDTNSYGLDAIIVEALQLP